MQFEHCRAERVIAFNAALRLKSIPLASDSNPSSFGWHGVYPKDFNALHRLRSIFKLSPVIATSCSKMWTTFEDLDP